jgi:hypothetical protein
LKRLFLSIALSLSFISVAYSQFSGQLSTPKTLASGQSRVGGYAGIYENALGVLGQYRYGLGAYTDLGFKLGLMDLDHQNGSNAGIDLAFDGKYQVMEMRLHDPIDLSIGGVTELLAVENLSILSLGGFAVGSYPVKLSNGRILEPYGRLIIRVERTDVHHGSSTDLQLGLNMGTAFELSKSTRAFGELQFDERFAFYMGLEFEI